jgi:hypothetical protein
MAASEPVTQLFEQILLLKEHAEMGEDLDPDQGSQLMAQIRAAVPTSTREDVVRMNRLVQETMKVIADRHKDIGDELAVVNNGRKALNGYNHLRGFDTEQRLYKQV